MSFSFWKMQACGNDFVVVDMRQKTIPIDSTLIKKLGDRHFGIGFDSLLVLYPAKNPDADALYRVFNADGTEAGQCGNGARCIAQFLFHQNNQAKKHFLLETINQPIALEVIDEHSVRCDLALPILNATQLPIKIVPQNNDELAYYSLEYKEKIIDFYGVSLGNPHAVIFVEDCDKAEVKTLGAFFNNHPAFPEGINVSFVQIQSEHAIKLRVYERGVGETLACGSAACASTIVSLLLDKVKNPVHVFLPGGMVDVNWAGLNKAVQITGPGEFVFKGIWDVTMS